MTHFYSGENYLTTVKTGRMLRRIALLEWVAFAFLVVGCKPNFGKDVEAKLADSLAAVRAIIIEDSTAIAQNELNAWIATLLGKEQLNWNILNLQEYGKEELKEAESFAASKEFVTDYSEVLRWSPDSSHILDIGSFGAVVVKDASGKPRVEAREADTEISLLNVKGQHKRSLLFVGPSSVIIDATWVDTSNALILGSFDEQGNQQPDTLFWIINIKDNFYRMYKLKR
jgi:hypothetical protein